ncbi:unnamed protein product [Diabrotica balteata]|uniref:Aprataxin and PNK-like factor n=1 Tax=Diabrotica balteata TaxID=107213 RepID=A0A9N9SVR9_DIABA|nr:unnamed protein product [Diabrotica balteata]
MPILKIYALDDQEEASVISAFPEGEHSIGRDKLNCKDKRVSRNHALITITDNSITLHSTHVNPSFYKPHGGNSIRLVKKDESVTINDGDQFAFLADAYWFKTRIEQSEINLDSSSNKRIHEENEIYDNQKRAKVDNIENINEESTKSAVSDNIDNQESKGCVSDSEGSIDFATSLQNEDDIPNEEDPKDTTEDNIEKPTEENNPEDTITTENNRESILNEVEPSREQNDTEDNKNDDNEVNPLNEINQNDESKQETKTDNGDSSTNDPSSSKTKREPCWYGAKCYRKNAAHKQAFSHPGDSDYEDNEVPECPYGTGCYRTNAIHRKQYKHTKPPAPKPVPATTKNDESEDEESGDDSPVGKRKRKAVAKAKNYAESPEDDYDLQDPFINDGSSDDLNCQMMVTMMIGKILKKLKKKVKTQGGF